MNLCGGVVVLGGGVVVLGGVDVLGCALSLGGLVVVDSVLLGVLVVGLAFCPYGITRARTPSNVSTVYHLLYHHYRTM